MNQKFIVPGSMPSDYSDDVLGGLVSRIWPGSPGGWSLTGLKVYSGGLAFLGLGE